MSSIDSKAMYLSRRHIGGRTLSAFFAAALLVASQAIAAQQPQPPAQAANGTATKRSPRHRAVPAQIGTPAAPERASAPPQTELPKWPVNETPNKPTVTWDSAGLKIEANNSSLHDILNQVSTDTGAKLEGMGDDERIFGEYGPGTARDVISQLLHGSSYNVLMIGDQGAGTPRQIVLSARRGGSNPQPANRSFQPQTQDQSDEDIPDQPEDNDQSGQPPMINGRPPMQIMPPGIQQGPQGPPGAPRTPQQVLQELQQRQQQIQDQQQQQPPQ